MLAVVMALLLLSSCQSTKPAMPAPDTAAVSGALAEGISYGYREYTYAEGFSYGLASKWEMRPVGKVTVNFCAPASNLYPISLMIEDSESRLLGNTGLLMPGCHLTELQLTGIPPETDEICLTIFAYQEDGEVQYTASRYETLVRTYD